MFPRPPRDYSLALAGSRKTNVARTCVKSRQTCLCDPLLQFTLRGFGRRSWEGRKPASALFHRNCSPLFFWSPQLIPSSQPVDCTWFLGTSPLEVTPGHLDQPVDEPQQLKYLNTPRIHTQTQALAIPANPTPQPPVGWQRCSLANVATSSQAFVQLDQFILD